MVHQQSGKIDEIGEYLVDYFEFPFVQHLAWSKTWLPLYLYPSQELNESLLFPCLIFIGFISPRKDNQKKSQKGEIFYELNIV